MTCREWLDANKAILEKYDLAEKAQMAIQVGGFSLEEVSATLPEWHMDTLTHTNYRIRQAYFVEREIKAAEQGTGKPDLGEQWHHLFDHIEFGRDFGDLR